MFPEPAPIPDETNHNQAPAANNPDPDNNPGEDFDQAIPENRGGNEPVARELSPDGVKGYLDAVLLKIKPQATASTMVDIGFEVSRKLRHPQLGPVGLVTFFPPTFTEAVNSRSPINSTADLILDAFVELHSYYQGCLSFMVSLQSRQRRRRVRQPREGVPLFPESACHLNAYLTPQNILLPDRISPFASDLMEKIRACLCSVGTVKKDELSRVIANLKASITKLKLVLSGAKHLDCPARVEVGFKIVDSATLQSDIRLMAEHLNDMDFDYLLTKDYFSHLSLLFDNSFKLIEETVARCQDNVPLKDLPLIAIGDALLKDLVIQGRTLSFLNDTLYPNTGANILDIINSTNRICLHLPDNGLFRNDLGHLEAEKEPLLDLLSSLMRWSENRQDTASAAILRGFHEICAADDAESRTNRMAECLHQAYCISLADELGLKLGNINAEFLGCNGYIKDSVDRQKAKDAIFDTGLLDLVQRPRSLHIALLGFLRSNYTPEQIEAAISMTSNYLPLRISSEFPFRPYGLS